MLAYQEFGELRLSHFVEPAKISPLANWEFMGRVWVGEAIGFSEWLRLKRTPSILGSLALDFAELSPSVCSAVLTKLRLPLERGMTLSQLEAVLGAPTSTEVFTADRKTYEFAFGSPDRYAISCTVLNRGGLSYLVVMQPIQAGARRA